MEPLPVKSRRFVMHGVSGPSLARLGESGDSLGVRHAGCGSRAARYRSTGVWGRASHAGIAGGPLS